MSSRSCSATSGARCRARRRSCSTGCARRCGRLPLPTPALGQVPLAGGLVGFTSYDMVRFFERLPQRLPVLPGVPLLHYLAPRSLLVFDHVSRGIALLHAGSDAERESLRREVIRALRGAVPFIRSGGGFSVPIPALTRDEHIAGVLRAQEYIAAGDVYQLVLSSRFSGRHALDPFQVYRALRLINPSPVYVFLPPRRPDRGGLLARGTGQAQRPPGGAAADRRHAAAGRRAAARRAPGGGAARRWQGKRRARDAGGPGAQRSGPRRLRRQRAGRTVPLDRALQPCDAHRQRSAR